MHVHLPKPLHGWRAFAGEVGIIVIGVLIALSAEQVVETLHWRSEVANARAAINDDIGQTNRAFAFRVAAHGCIARRLTALNAIIERAAKHEPVPLLGEIIPDIGNALLKNAWDTSRAAQTLAHFDQKALHLYGQYYVGVDNVQYFMGREVDDVGVLQVLQGDPGRLGPTDISGLRVAVRHARFENDIIAGIAQEELDTSRLIGIAVPKADRSRVAAVCRPL